MVDKKYKYGVKLVPLQIENKEQDAFRDELYNIPYLLYEVEKISTGEIIAINKPGGKRNFGRLARNDFMVFIFNPREQSLWLISHKEISDDIKKKYSYAKKEAIELIKGLYCVCCGEEPGDIINRLKLSDTIGIKVETLLKVYKWIWGQEDCNYPTKDGRWYSMNEILKEFEINKEEIQCNNN